MNLRLHKLDHWFRLKMNGQHCDCGGGRARIWHKHCPSVTVDGFLSVVQAKKKRGQRVLISKEARDERASAGERESRGGRREGGEYLPVRLTRTVKVKARVI